MSIKLKKTDEKKFFGVTENFFWENQFFYFLVSFKKHLEKEKNFFRISAKGGGDFENSRCWRFSSRSFVWNWLHDFVHLQSSFRVDWKIENHRLSKCRRLSRLVWTRRIWFDCSGYCHEKYKRHTTCENYSLKGQNLPKNFYHEQQRIFSRRLFCFCRRIFFQTDSRTRGRI